ncbi:hypothetical protein FRC03_001830 [Tulasnella sp. 419]|nr:hypothetical protein FRC03_001830 [Tulasnella sp. 419]
MYKPRLEASGLWEVLDEKDKKDEIQVNSWTLKSKANETFGHAETLRRTFGKEKILEKGKAVFDLLTSLLKQSSFIFNERPSILDVRLAAHILLLLHAPLPNPLLKTLLLDSYTPLVDHALLVRTYAFPSSDPSRPAPPVEPLEHSSVTQNLWLVGGAAQRVFHTTFGSDVASA